MKDRYSKLERIEIDTVAVLFIPLLCILPNGTTNQIRERV